MPTTKITTLVANKKHVPTTQISEVRQSDYENWLQNQSQTVQNWLISTGFKAKPASLSLVPDAEGKLQQVVFVLPDQANLWDWARLPAALPEGTYCLEEGMAPAMAETAALAWGLATYSFDRYKKREKIFPSLIWPQDAERVRHMLEATYLVRDLVNTPANDMGPAELAEEACTLARQHQGTCHVIVGEDLLSENYPAIHAIGRASPKLPRLIDLQWGKQTDPRVTLVGKGVCFDTGGLDLKPSSGMILMKKDMAGSANVLGVASLIMASKLPVRLRVLIPAVENVISGNAVFPSDVIQSRKGLSIEITNTDAEGRVVLADALTTACEDNPELIIDFATLTGAARVAVGTELPAFFCNDKKLANEFFSQGEQNSDPVWQLPLWQDYSEDLDSPIADICNSPSSRYGGAIAAGLFLQRFVDEGTAWIHLDLMGWNLKTRPGRPVGGEAMAMRAVYHLIKDRFDPERGGFRT